MNEIEDKDNEVIALKLTNDSSTIDQLERGTSFVMKQAKILLEGKEVLIERQFSIPFSAISDTITAPHTF